MSYAPLSGDELSALKTLISKQFRYPAGLVIDIVKNQSLISFGIAIRSNIFFDLPSLLTKLPQGTVEVSLQEDRIVMVGKLVDILGVTQFLAENACSQRLHRAGSSLCSVADTAKQI